MARPEQKKTLYENCKMLAPCGTPMCIVSARKAEWYLKRNLAKLVDTNTIQLNFQPKGLGYNNDLYYLIPKENKCVVCGCKENLTRHHVIPRCYRTFFPQELKSGLSHDVLLLCNDCHRRYEKYALSLKKKLADTYTAPLHGIGLYIDKRMYAITRSARTLLLKGHEIPIEKQDRRWRFVEGYLGKNRSQITKEDLQLAADAKITIKTPSYKSHGQMVMEQIGENLPQFIRMWREHFLTTMRPQHLPYLWSVDHERLNNTLEHQ